MAVRFSVIVPVYKVEHRLGICIDSILAQSCPDFELILVDDGSPDGCGAICDRYAARDSRVRVIHKANGGLVSARQAGAALAVGDYVCCVDGDDWISPDCLEKLSAAVEEYAPDILCFNLARVREHETRPDRMPYPPGYYDRARIEAELFPSLIQTASATYFFTSLCTKAIRRTLYLPAQQAVPPAVSIAEDRSVSVPCVYRCRSLLLLDDCLYYYWVNEQSMTRSKPYSWEGLAAASERMREAVDLSEGDFQAQYDRVVAHDFFNAAKSQFNRKEPYRVIRADILDKLRQPLFAEAIRNCRFTGAKARLMALCLKKRWIFPIWAFHKLS